MPFSTTAGPDPAATPGTAPTAVPPTVPGYRCERLLGRGGMGEVWLAHHETLARTVALKVMRPDLARDPAYSERFVREARSSARVAHPGVVTVHDAGSAGGHLFLAMEFVPGGDLQQRLADRSLNVQQAVTLIADAAEALQAIHDAGLVHRDIKPDNILLDAQGRPRIADLGLARMQMGDDRMTATGMAMGTPAYMSPEQANGSPDLDGRSDVYSLAATLFALFAGRPPFVGPTPYATVSQVLNEAPPDLRAINPKVPAAIAAVVQRALAKTPAQRPATARAFADSLRAALTAPAGSATGGSTARVPKAVWIGGGVLAAIVLLGVIIGLASGSDSASASGSSPAATPKSDSAAGKPAATRTEPVADTPVEAFRTIKRNLRGTVLDAMDGTLPEVHQAIRDACASQSLAILKDKGDATTARVEARLPGGDTVTITLSPMSSKSTQVSVQIGAFGDEARSKVVLGWIRDEL